MISRTSEASLRLKNDIIEALLVWCKVNQQYKMNQQNNLQTSLQPSDTIDSNRIIFDRPLLARKKDIIEQFLSNQDDSNDLIINYPNDFLQKMAEGQLKDFGKLTLHRSVSTIYFGETCNQLYHGYGLLLYKGGQLRFYEGYFQNNCKYGYGMEYISGDTYVGRFVNNKPQDQNGLFFWANGDVYHGSFVNGMKHGQGKWQSGEEFYSGSWKYNKPQGQGFIRSALSEYKGDIKNGYKHGKGLQAFNNGDRYQGQYSNGKPQGQGNYFWSNGSIYRGQFKNGLRFGYGIWQFGGQKYEGTYVNDKRNGEGKYTWGGGSYYVGNFVEDLRHGFGQMHWDANSYYKGEWFQGKQNGQGQVWEGGKMIEKGYYQEGKVKIKVSQEQSQRRLFPINPMGKKSNQVNSHPHSDRKRFNSFQSNNKQSIKLQKLNNQKTSNQLQLDQQRDHLKQKSKRYSAHNNKSIASKSFRAPNSPLLRPEKSNDKQDKQDKVISNRISLYKRLRKEKQSEPLAKKIPVSKLPKTTENQLLFETQLAPIKWRNFGHIPRN